MTQRALSIAASLMLATSTLGAQNVTGTWQGTLETGPQPARLLLQLAREADGRLTAALFILDRGGFGAPAVAYSASLTGGVLRASFAQSDFQGSVDALGTTITGTLTAAAGGPNAPRVRALAFVRPSPATAWRDSSAHHARFITVEPNVQLEVLDWGGTGRPVVLLAGLGNSAHVFDDLAPKLADRYHVYAITRRGFAPSSIPTSGYLADSLADDVLTVLDSLHLAHPVLVGHSLAGQELSSVGSRHPERVAGLVYLDAGWQYAFYDPTVEDNATYVIPDVQRRLALIFDRWAPISFAERAAMIRELADTTLPILTRDLRLWANGLAEAPNPTVRPTGVRRDPVLAAIFAGGQRYTHIVGPVLAIYVAPQALRPNAPADSAGRAALDSLSLSVRMPQITKFQRGVPQARVVKLAHADHFVWRSNEADVLREMRAFIDALPAAP
jgi:pimeloyl-ACP methyl ester carboxylesterase